jgi:tRNA(fMet)-specific endonuclease VapC
MYLLDTNIVSNFLDERRYYPQLTERILSKPSELIFISVITVEEIIQGALATIQKARRTTSVTIAYQYFEELLAALHRFQILSYTVEAEYIYQSLPAKVTTNRNSRLSNRCNCLLKKIYFNYSERN